jgi:aspartate aminotransferase-like enzyme
MTESLFSLFTVGPVALFPRTIELSRLPIPYNRTFAFAARTRIMVEGLKRLFETNGEVLILTSSGTGAMEAALGGLFPPGAKVVVVTGGTFGQRWADLSRRLGLEVTELAPPPGESVDPEQVGMLLDRHAFDGLVVTAHETSTGVLHDLRTIGRQAKSRGVLFLVDAISTVLADPFLMDEWGIDAAVLSSPKGLALPPGLAFVAVGNTAMETIERLRPRSLYFDLQEYIVNQKRGQLPFTPAISLLVLLEDRLQQVLEAGVSHWQRESARLAGYFRAAISDLPLLQKVRSPSSALTALACPAELPSSSWVNYLRDQHAIYVSPNGGAGGHHGFRVGHMGCQTFADLDRLVEALQSFAAAHGRSR